MAPAGDAFRPAALRLLGQLGSSGAQAGSTENLVKEVLRTVCSACEWRAGEFWRYDAGLGQLVAQGGWGADLPARRFLEQSVSYGFPKGVGAVGRAWLEGDVVIVAGLAEDPSFLRRREAFGAGLGSMIALPVPGFEGVEGVLGFFGGVPRSAEAERQERLLLPGRVELATVASAFLSGALVGRHEPSAAGEVGSRG